MKLMKMNTVTLSEARSYDSCTHSFIANRL